MYRLSRLFPILIVAFSSLLIVGWFFGDALFNPNQYLFGNTGDGIKNYYNPCYYMKHDSGVRTNSFTYPYGELALFTDCHFSYVYLLNLIDDYVVEINSYTVAFLNMAMMSSIVLCSVFLFLLLRYFKLPNWYALIFALIITFLSPQLERLIAHYSLSWSFFIPMIWYFLLQLLEWKRPIIYTCLLIVSILFFGFLHPYYLPASVFFLAAFAGIYTLLHLRELRSYYKQIISVFCAAIIPFILFSLFIYFNDTVTDRHLSPYGMFAYNSSFEGVFMPHRSPMYTSLNQLFTITPPKTDEGHSYVGIIGVLALILTALRLIWNLLKKRQLSMSRIFVNGKLSVSVVAAGLVFYLSTGHLFKNFEFLLEWIPRLRQFRSLGRFAWVLYYCFAVYAAYLLYICSRALALKGKKPVGLLLIVAFGTLWAIESYWHSTFYIYKATNPLKLNDVFYKDPKTFTNALKNTPYKASDFQAIIGFPYINNGTEKLYIYREGKAPFQMMKCSYETGLPLATFHSPRTSIKQGIKLAQLVSSEYVTKEILPELNDKPLLLIEANGRVHPGSRRLLNLTEKVYGNDFFILYNADLSVFKTNHQWLTDRFKKAKDELIKYDNYFTSKPTKAVTIIRYPVSNSPVIFRDHGVFQSGKDKETIVFDDKIQFDSIAEFIEISAWMYLDPRHASIPVLKYEEFDASNQVVQSKEIFGKWHTEVITDFARSTIYLKPKDSSNRIRVSIKSENEFTWNNTFADVLIRPSNVDVYFDIKSDNSFILNNYSIEFEE